MREKRCSGCFIDTPELLCVLASVKLVINESRKAVEGIPDCVIQPVDMEAVR
jgi:hypothetical protein